jgi:multidrug resistance efflux pump
LIEEQERPIDLKKVELDNVHRNKELMAELQETLAGRNAVLDKARRDLTRAQSMAEIGLMSSRDFEAADNAVKVNTIAVQETQARIRALTEKETNDGDLLMKYLAVAESRLASMKAGNRPGEIQKAEAEVNRLEKNLEFLTRELKKTDIVAPINGVVTTEFVERKRGTYLDPGQELMQLVDTSSVVARLMVPQKELEDVLPGNRVLLKLDSFSTQVFEGKVDSIAPGAQTESGQQFVPVRSILMNKDGILKPDLTGNAKIYCGKRRIIELMTRRVDKWFRREFWDLRP